MAARSVKRLALVHGVNLDMLGRRPREHYGSLTLSELEDRVTRYAQQRGFSVTTFQTNHEGVLIEHLHELAVSDIDALVINPGAWTHYSYAIRDALELISAPIAEVHLSAVDERERWRTVSVIAELATARVAGKGLEGYFEAVEILARELTAGRLPRRPEPTDD